MILYNHKKVEIEHFPDGTIRMKEKIERTKTAVLTWKYEREEELVALMFLTRHIKSKGVKEICLELPYFPNARFDRVKSEEEVFTLKYFCEMINGLGYQKVRVLDPHSYVGEALLDRIEVQSPQEYVEKVRMELEKSGEEVLFFYPDEGAMKRYSGMFDRPFVYGLKNRDWATGRIKDLSLAGQTEQIKGRKVLIVDDICSRGGTFYHSAKALKEAGAKEIYLYISHCENSILEGELLKMDLVKRIYTTDSIFTKEHEKVEVMRYE